MQKQRGFSHFASCVVRSFFEHSHCRPPNTEPSSVSHYFFIHSFISVCQCLLRRGGLYSLWFSFPKVCLIGYVRLTCSFQDIMSCWGVFFRTFCPVDPQTSVPHWIIIIMFNLIQAVLQYFEQRKTSVY